MKPVVTLAILGLAATASADPVDTPRPSVPAPAWSLDFGSHVRWFGDTSAAILTTDTLAGPRITLGRSLTRVAARNRELEVGVFARWVYATASGTVFQDLKTAIDQQAFTGGIRLDAPLAWRARLVGQAEAGMARTALRVTQDAMEPVDDHGWGLYGAASLGTQLDFVDVPKFRLGLTVDVGYTVAAPVKLRALPGDRPDENLSIPTTYASIGSLDTRGWTYSMALRGSF